MSAPATLGGTVVKAEEDERLVYGWASVISRNGAPVVDRQGDVIEGETLEKAATRFMLSARAGKIMHAGAPVATVVHSFPLTKSIAEAFGISSDAEGWLIAMRVEDEALWQRVKGGEFPAFSIGGRGRRVPVTEG